MELVSTQKSRKKEKKKKRVGLGHTSMKVRKFSLCFLALEKAFMETWNWVAYSRYFLKIPIFWFRRSARVDSVDQL